MSILKYTSNLIISNGTSRNANFLNGLKNFPNFKNVSVAFYKDLPDPPKPIGKLSICNKLKIDPVYFILINSSGWLP